MMPIVLLPGMDGTGELFDKFATHLNETVRPQVVRYPVDIPQSLECLVDYVESAVPKNEPYFLLAESFSGRIAFEVAHRQKTRVAAIIFVATFLKSPRPLLLRFNDFIPIQWMKMLEPPNWFVKRYFVGVDKSSCDVQDFKNIVMQVPPQILKQRLSMIANLTLPQKELDVPVLYLQAANDLLVSQKSCEDFKLCCPDLTVKQIEGRHFLLQSSPELSAYCVKNFLERSLV